MALALDRSLILRIVSALILAPVAIYAMIVGGTAFLLMIGIAIGIAIKEWHAICRASAAPFLRAFVGMLYILGGFAAFIYLRQSYPNGAGLALALMLCIWASDIGAYFAGRLIGGPKLAPRISPKKTWAGFVGGLLSSAACLLAYAWYAGPFITARIGYDLNALPDYAWLPLAIIGGSITVSGQAGDLIESNEKRKAGMKDSGVLIPGHGGILDRIDSLLLAAPLFLLTLGVFGL